MTRLFMLGALLVNALAGVGCDQCGCGILFGIQPFDHANSFGLQYRMRYLHGDLPTTLPVVLAKHGSMGAAGSPERVATYTEVYNVLEMRGQFWLSTRLSLAGSVPLVNNYQAVDQVRYADVYTIGDPTLMGRYAVLNRRSAHDSIVTRQRLTLGLGTKLPLAQHDVEQFGQELDHDLQPGTGTWDALMSAEYMRRGEHWGLSIGTLGRYNGTNAEGHQMGHSLSTTAEVFRIVQLNKVQWMPSLGGYAELTMRDRMDGIDLAGTGGSVFFSHLGSRFWRGAFGFSLTWQHALVNGEGAVMVPNRDRLLAGITYNINNN